MYGRSNKSLAPLLISLLSLGLAANAHAQNSAGTVTTITPAAETGVPSGGSFAGDHESINMANGNVNVRIPLLNLPGLGGLNFRLDLIIDSNTSGFSGEPSTPDYPGGNTYDGPEWIAKPCGVGFAGGCLSIPLIQSSWVQINPDPNDTSIPTIQCLGGFIIVDADGSQHAF